MLEIVAPIGRRRARDIQFRSSTKPRNTDAGQPVGSTRIKVGPQRLRRLSIGSAIHLRARITVEMVTRKSPDSNSYGNRGAYDAQNAPAATTCNQGSEAASSKASHPAQSR